MISPERLEQLALAAHRNSELASLRQAFPELHFSACSEDDVSPRYRPAYDGEHFALYLITGASGHCLELTHDPAIATGILVAAKADEA